MFSVEFRELLAFRSRKILMLMAPKGQLHFRSAAGCRVSPFTLDSGGP